VTMAWAAAPRLMRVELPGMGVTLHIILNRRDDPG
jgi:hypothetical protein